MRKCDKNLHVPIATIKLSQNEKKIIIMFVQTADIYEEVSSSVRGLGLDTECLGGGRINHQPNEKKIKVYGYSQVRNIYSIKTLMCLYVKIYCLIIFYMFI